MIRLAEKAIADRYLEGLNACFPGWGGRETFDWCFHRAAGARSADLLVLEEEGNLIAGSAVTYRRAVRGPAARPEPVACMTGSWTLPPARGRGIFKAMIDASRAQARKRGCRLLMAFGRAENPSAKGLARAGATMLPAFYLVSKAPAASGLSDAGVDEAMAAFASHKPDREVSGLVYAAAEWRGQMIDRPHPVRAVRLPDGHFALVEQGAGADQLLDVSSPDPMVLVQAAAAIAGQRPLMAYTLDSGAAEALVDRGFAASEGSLYLLGTDGSSPAPERWTAANGDRM